MRNYHAPDQDTRRDQETTSNTASTPSFDTVEGWKKSIEACVGKRRQISAAVAATVSSEYSRRSRQIRMRFNQAPVLQTARQHCDWRVFSMLAMSDDAVAFVRRRGPVTPRLLRASVVIDMSVGGASQHLSRSGTPPLEDYFKIHHHFEALPMYNAELLWCEQTGRTARIFDR
jgi:hypothetical protein